MHRKMLQSQYEECFVGLGPG